MNHLPMKFNYNSHKVFSYSTIRKRNDELLNKRVKIITSHIAEVHSNFHISIEKVSVQYFETMFLFLLHVVYLEFYITYYEYIVKGEQTQIIMKIF